MQDNPNAESVIPDRSSDQMSRVRWHGWDEDVITGCWIFLGPVGAKGYGQFKFRGKQVLAHRAVAAHGAGRELFPNEIVMHVCDTPKCVNPDHLTIGSVRDNVLDKMRKGRFRPSNGERNGMSRLTANDVREIRNRAKSGERHRDISKAFGISEKYVGSLVQRTRWSHI